MEPIGQYDLAGLHILLVENNQQMRRIIQSILNSLGITNIKEAGDAAEGKRIAQEHDVDIILCSWQKDITDGPEFVKSIRTGKNSRNPYVPIIMLSSHTEKFRITEARDAGVNEFLAKPLSPKSLYQRITTIIEKPRPFIRTASYFGPCRRRQNLGPPKGIPERRRSDPKAVTAESEYLKDS